jgi:3-hydroxyisobutyrate dehydrogenase
MAKPSVAILGLGIMGSGMAARLLSADFPLAVYNRNREKCVPLGAAGAFVAPTPRDAASRAEIVLSMVADDAASRDLWLGESGALKGASPGSVLIESSTLSVDWVRTLAAEAVERECKFLDARLLARSLMPLLANCYSWWVARWRCCKKRGQFSLC